MAGKTKKANQKQLNYYHLNKKEVNSLTLKEIEEFAYRQSEIPSSLTIDEQKFFVVMRNIYYLYHNNIIGQSQAVSEKKKAYSALQKQMEINTMMADMFNQTHENLQRSEELRCKINKEENTEKKLELALECIRLLTGDELVGVK